MREPDPYVESIELPGGWRGEVLCRCPYPTPQSDKPCALPDTGQWHSWLTSLTTDSSALCGYTVVKVSAGAEVFRARMDCSDGMIDVIGKQSRGSGSARWLNGAWRPSRARRNFRKGLALLRAEISTALPLAWIERRRPQRESWLVTRFVPDLVDLDQVALSLIVQLETKQVRAVKDGIITALVELLLQFDRHGLHHRDLKASNILLQSWDGGSGAAHTLLADLDGLPQHQVDLEKKCFNGVKIRGPNRREKARCGLRLRSYTPRTTPQINRHERPAINYWPYWCTP